MPEIELTENEASDLREQEQMINAIGGQIEGLMQQRNRAIKTSKYIWTSASQRCKLNGSLDTNCIVPELINAQNLDSPIKINGNIASWEDKE